VSTWGQGVNLHGLTLASVATSFSCVSEGTGSPAAMEATSTRSGTGSDAGAVTFIREFRWSICASRANAS